MQQPNNPIPVSSADALRFFHGYLAAAARRVPKYDIGPNIRLYLATIMAHYAQVSSAAQGEHLPMARSWSGLHQSYADCLRAGGDTCVIRELAAQGLLLSGFFRRHVVGDRDLAGSLWFGIQLCDQSISASHPEWNPTMVLVRDYYVTLSNLLDSVSRAIERDCRRRVEEAMLIRIFDLDSPPQA